MSAPTAAPAVSRLALGTVQFGLPYGIANASGQVTPAEADKILRVAMAGGIDTLDTAIAYGDSESVLGRLHSGRFNIITKLPALPDDVTDAGGWIRAQVDASLARLCVDRLDGLLLHRPDQLLGRHGADIYNALTSLRGSGQVRRIGISVYEPAQLDALSAFSLDLVQAPLNVFDQRMLRSGWLNRLQRNGVAFHARSAFLQGLLLMPPEQRPAQFAVWGDAWKLWDDWLGAQRLSPLEACLRFAVQASGVERVVVGVDSGKQLQSILAAVRGPMPELPEALARIEPLLLNPANWSKS